MAYTRRVAVGYTIGAIVSLILAAICGSVLLFVGARPEWTALVCSSGLGISAGTTGECGFFALHWWRMYCEERASHGRFFSALTDLADLAERKG
jgi:hypothetical protein